MHTGAGSGNSNTALSWAVKEDNTSCPLWTGLVNAQIPLFRRQTSHFTERTFSFIFFIFSKMAYCGMSVYLFQCSQLQWESVTTAVAVSSLMWSLELPYNYHTFLNKTITSLHSHNNWFMTCFGSKLQLTLQSFFLFPCMLSLKQ